MGGRQAENILLVPGAQEGKRGGGGGGGGLLLAEQQHIHGIIRCDSSELPRKWLLLRTVPDIIAFFAVELQPGKKVSCVQ